MIGYIADWGQLQVDRLRALRRYMVRTAKVRRSHQLHRGLVPWIQGWQPDERTIYRLDENDRRQYLSDWQHWRATRINGNARVLTNNKVVFERIFGDLLHVPRNHAEAGGGRMRSMRLEDLGAPVTLAELMRRVAHGIVAKPSGTGGGADIAVLLKDEGGDIDALRWNGERMSVGDAEQRLVRERSRILCEFIRQAEYSRRVFPRSTNTLRILTMVDPKDGTIFIPAAVHRIGTNASAPIDNWSCGSISAGIDLDTGRLRAGAICPPRREPLRWLEHHPETGESIDGIEIPNWSQIKSAIVDAVRRFPVLKVVGWDVVVTDSGFAVIEGNSGPDVKAIQLHGGLLSDDRVRRVFEAAGIITKRGSTRSA